MRFIDLCAGIGGFSLGLEMAGLTCAGQVEIDDYCTRILEKHWPAVPRWRDVTSVNPADLPTVELICGGYPCQPFSHAGQRRGAADDRHLWPAFAGIIQAKRPAWCLFENVTGHITLGLDQVLSELESLDYAARPVVIPACATDAPHIRARVWIVAHTGGDRLRRERDLRDYREFTEPFSQREATQPRQSSEVPGDVAHTEGRAERRGLCQSEQAEQRRGRLGDGRGEGGGGLFSDPAINRRDTRRPEPEGQQRAAELDDGGGHVPDSDNGRGGSDNRGRTPEYEPGQRRPIKSEFCRVADEFSEGLDKGGLNGEKSQRKPGQILFDVQKTNGTSTLPKPPRGLGRFQAPPVLQSGVHGDWADAQEPEQERNSEANTEVQKPDMRKMRRNALCGDSPQGWELAEQRPKQFSDVVRELSRYIASQSIGYSGQERETAMLCLRKALISIGVLPYTSNAIQEAWESLSSETAAWVWMAACGGPWTGEWPNIPRIASGVPHRVNRLKVLGNAVVPQVVAEIGRAIMAAHYGSPN